MTVSHWTRALPGGPLVEADAVVVGAGICGVAAAVAMERRGLKVQTFERGTVGCGASTRNAGFLMRGAAENYAAAARQYGRERAAQVWQWTERNLAELRAEGIGALHSYQATPSCLLALEPGELAELQESLDLLRADGFRADWVERGEDSAWKSRACPPLGGLLNPDDAAVNPAELMRFLNGKLRAPVREGCEVIAIREHDGRAEVLTTRGTFRAPRVMVCTNAFVGSLLPSLAGVITARRGQMLALRQPGVRLDYSYYANRGYEYFRQDPDETVVVGGCRKQFADTEVGVEDRATEPVQEAIEDFASAVLGIERGELNVVARWSGAMDFSPDGLPVAGPVEGEWPAGSVWYCGGFTGHGMSMAWRTAHAAVLSMLDGASNPFPLSRVNADAGQRKERPAAR